MWREFSISFIKKNQSTNVSICVAAFISALFLSLLCTLFFNFWTYEIEQIILQEGDWQGRISGNMVEEDLFIIQNFANVDKVTVNEELSDKQNQTIEVYFDNPKTIFTDMPLIAKRLGIEEDAVAYHDLLLSKYLIHNPSDDTPPLLITFYLLILLLVSFSLVLIIHNSFAVSMHTRIHQFGILSSIGATPGQIRSCLIQEAAALCTIPILVGSIVGIGGSFVIMQAINTFADGMSGRHKAAFAYHPLIYGITVLAAVLTVFISVWLPARKLSKLTPLEAIKNIGELKLKKKKHSNILLFLFGIEGELAGNALKAQKKALRTSTLALTFSFSAFTWMLCFFTLSEISTNYTYFAKYQNAWDVMITVKDTGIEEFSKIKEVQALPDVRSCVVYQRGTALSLIPTHNLSEELLALGGLETLAGDSVAGAGYLVSTPLVILEDAGFLEYCKQIGIPATLDGAVILNRIWNSTHSNFRYKEYVPYLNEKQDTISLQNTAKDTSIAQIPIKGYTQKEPVLREEYDNYALIVYISSSEWTYLSGQLENRESNTYIRILAEEGITLDELNTLEATLAQIVGQEYDIESENRIQERITDEKARDGMMMILGAFCILLEVIGIANVFSNTLGFIKQRKREFARYMSIGMTLAEMRKIFCIEALVIAGRPLLITLPVTVLAVGYMITASYLNPVEFLVKTPVIPVIVFIITIFIFVAWAYYLGGKRIMKNNLIDSLRDESFL